MRLRASHVMGLVLTVLVLAVVIGLRPWWHGLAMFFYVWPIPSVVFVLGVIAIAVAMIKGDSYGEGRKGFGWAVSVAVICVIVFLVYIFCGGSWVANSLYQQTEYGEITEMPTNDPDGLRLLPYQVAHKYATDSFVEPTEKLGDTDVQMDAKGNLVYRMPKVPDGTILYFQNKPTGYQDVAASGTGLSVTSGGERMEIGEDIAITDSYTWVLYKQNYWVDLTDPYYVEDGDQTLMVVPYIGYRGFWYKTPYFAGVYIVYPDGNVKEYTPDEAAELSYIRGNRLYPEELVRRQVEAYAYKNGIWNKWFYHREEIEVADISGDNKFPFYIRTQVGPRWVTPCEPQGDSYGIIKVFYTNAVTGEIEIFSVPKDQLLTGPNRAADYVKQALPQFDWVSGDGDSTSGNFITIEPRPVVVDNNLYWMLSVVNKNYSGVARTVFVNSETNEVYAFELDSEVLEFMAGPQEAEPVTSATAGTIGSSTTTATADVPLSTDERQAIIEAIEKIETDLAVLRSRLATTTE